MRTARGVSTRVTWTSRANRSWPTPTVKTGIDRALRPRAFRRCAASEVSAPSETITSPASGRPGELVARAIERRREARRRCRRTSRSPAVPTRSDEDEKRKNRTTNFCDSAASSCAFGPLQLLLHERAARLAVEVRDRHAARVVDQDAEEILLRHRRLEHQRGPEQAEEQDRQRRQPQADQHHAVARGDRRPRCPDTSAARGRPAPHRRDDEQDRAGQTPGEIALLKEQGRVFEKEAEEVIQHQALILPGPAPVSRTHRTFFPRARRDHSGTRWFRRICRADGRWRGREQRRCGRLEIGIGGVGVDPTLEPGPVPC